MLRKTTIAVAIAATLATSIVTASESSTTFSGTVQNVLTGKVYHTYGIGEMPASPQAVSYLTGTIPETYADLDAKGLAKVQFDSDAFIALKTGESVKVKLFNKDVDFTSEESVSHDNGDTSVVGNVDGERAIFTFGKDGATYGVVEQDGNKVSIATNADGETWVIDHNAAGVEYPEIGDDAITANAGATATTKTTATAQAAAVLTNAEKLAAQYGITKTTPKVVLDVFVMYSSTEPNAVTRINNLTAVTNAAYKDSGLIQMSMRVVGTQVIKGYADTTKNEAALAEMKGAYRTFAGTNVTRANLGADISIYLRPLKAAAQGSCGVSYLNGARGAALNATLTYAEVSDGVDGRYLCMETTMAHEIGHVLGANHDKAHAGNMPGAFPYSYGYGARGAYGDIMSYYTPQIAKFATPYVTAYTNAKGSKFYLGVENTSDVVKTFTQTAPVVAKFAPTKK